MKVVKCSNSNESHFFDGDMYKVCPHCGFPAITDNPLVQSEEKKKKHGFFGGHKSKGEYAEPHQPVSNEPIINDEFGRGNEPTVDLPQDPVTPSSSTEKKKDKTLDFWQTSSTPASSGEEISSLNEEKNPGDQKNDFENDPATSAVSLKDAVKQASASSEGKTMSYFSAVTSGGDMIKANQPSSNRPVDPVVGWLVCIHGEHFGESFNIGAGMNSIGRNETNRIVLNRDQSVSREKHALITYEPKHRKFYVKPGDSSGLTYLNDEYITETKPIIERDILELGNSKFIFIPLCCDSFTWEDHIKG